MTQSARNHDIYVLSKNRILNTAIERALIYSLRAGDLMKSISSISSTVLNKKPAVMAKSILCQRTIVSIHLCHAVRSDISYMRNRGTVKRSTIKI